MLSLSRFFRSGLTGRTALQNLIDICHKSSTDVFLLFYTGPCFAFFLLHEESPRI